MKQQPISFVVSENRNIVQRQTQEATVENLQPQSLITSNVTEVITASPEVSTTSTPKNTTIVAKIQINTNDSEIEENKSVHNRTNPIYYAQMGPNIANITPIGFHLNNNVKFSSEQPKEIDETTEPKSETTTIPHTTQPLDTKDYLDTKKPETNEISKDYNNFAELSFEKPAESVNIAYTILRASDKEFKVIHNKSSITGQLVEATVSDDKEFIKSRALSNRQSNQTVTKKGLGDSVPKDVVKAKIPPKSKLTFDDRTGEPILRVYASYVDSPARVSIYRLSHTHLI